jgi:hypothetical protein
MSYVQVNRRRSDSRYSTEKKRKSIKKKLQSTYRIWNIGIELQRDG